MASKPSLKSAAQIAALVVLAGVVIFVLGYHCPFRALTGIDCPGCGMSRALVSLLHGDLAGSLAWHPMLIPTLITVGFLAVFRKKPKARDRILWIWVAAMALCWIVRLIANI